MLHIKLKGMQQHGIKYFARRPPPPQPPSPPPRDTHILIQTPTTLGSKGQNSTFLEHGHVAYQIKGNHECSMVENILTANPGLWGWGQQVIIQLMQNMVMLHIKLKGITNEATGSKYFDRRRPSLPHPRPWGSKFNFFRTWSCAYQIRENHECSNMVAIITPADPLPSLTLRWGQNSCFYRKWSCCISN